MAFPVQANLFRHDNSHEVTEGVVKPVGSRAGSFVDNMKLPVYRWFRYSAGFSGDWAEQQIRSWPAKQVFDPFAGSGTTLIAAEKQGSSALGQEAHPFVARVCAAKLGWRCNPQDLLTMMTQVIAQAHREKEDKDHASLLTSCYSPYQLASLDKLRKSLYGFQSSDPVWQLAWLAFVAIARQTSHAGTAQWQYILPKKSKAQVIEPFLAFERKTHEIASDMLSMTRFCGAPQAQLLHEDARQRGHVPSGWADLVLTSPPYINNYDYGDATRLEMTLLGELGGWKDLRVVRENLVRSSTQQVSSSPELLDEALNSSELAGVHSVLAPAVMELSKVKLSRGGKKNYDSMVTHYFRDMAFVWKQLRRIARDGAHVCFVVGDSAPYGVHIPVEKLHGSLALEAGFSSYTFKKLRDRNTKWKNRKHSVPLHEGELWVHG